jgi:hypothetical protein
MMNTTIKYYTVVPESSCAAIPLLPFPLVQSKLVPYTRSFQPEEDILLLLCGNNNNVILGIEMLEKISFDRFGSLDSRVTDLKPLGNST